MAEYIFAGSTAQSIDVFLQDSSSSTGDGLTGLVYNSSGLTAYYRKGTTGSPVAISLQSRTLGQAWASGGFCEVDSTNMPGVYRLDLPDLMVDTAGYATLYLRGATNLLQTAVRIQCGTIAADVRQLNGSTQNADRMPISSSAQRTIAITGANHVAADIHETQDGSIREAAFDADAISARVIATDAIDGDAVAADAVTKIQSDLALQSTLLLVAQYVDTEITSIKAVTDKLNTGLVADGGVYQFTANMLELAPAGGGGGGGGGDATLANQTTILDQLDVIQAKTDLIGTSQALLAGAVLSPGTITSFPEVLTVGDSYTVANGREIQIPIIDSNGNPTSSSGTLLFADAEVTFIIKRAADTEASRILTCDATFYDPPGTGTGEGPYVTIEIPSAETAKGLLKYKYSGILKFTWPGTANEVVSFETGTITFDN